MSDLPLPDREDGLAPHAPFQWPIRIPDRPYDDQPRIGICFNHRWLPAIWGALETLLNLDTWAGTTEEQAWAVDQVLRIMTDLSACGEDELSECCDEILSKLDTIINLLSGGPQAGSWPEIRLALSLQVSAASYQNIHPYVPDLSWDTETGQAIGADVIRQKALCGALYQLLRATAQAINTQAIETAIEIPLFVTTRFGPLWGGLAFIASGVVLAGIEAILNDETAAKNLICCAVTEAADLEVGPDTLIYAIRECEVGANETILGEILVAQLSDPANFGLFLLEYADLVGLGFGSGLSMCPCDEEEGVICDTEGTVQGYDFPATGGSGWTPDSTGGSCQNFGTLLLGGGDFLGSSSFCLHAVHLRRFFGGTSSGEAVYAVVTVNGRTYEKEIEPGVDCSVDITPHQLITSSAGFRVDLVGGGEKMCYTGLRFEGVPVT